MKNRDIRIFLHDQFTRLNNIRKYLNPIINKIGIDIATVNDRVYYFNAVKKPIENILKYSFHLVSIMKEREIDSNKIIFIEDIIETLSKYLEIDNKFNPPFLFDRLSKFDLILGELKKDKIPNESCKKIRREISVVNSTLSEYFIRESYKLLSISIKKNEFLLDNELNMDHEDQERELLPVDIKYVIDRAIEFVQINSDEKKIEFRKKYSKQPLFVYGAKPNLIRVFGNLLQNAVKYNSTLSKYDVWIEIRLIINEHMISIEIENWGIGINSDEIENNLIYQSGYRGRQALENNIPGRGLGLYDAKKTIEEFGGTINVKSEKSLTSNKFITTFIIALRRYSAHNKVQNVHRR